MFVGHVKKIITNTQMKKLKPIEIYFLFTLVYVASIIVVLIIHLR